MSVVGARPRWLMILPYMPRADHASGHRRLVAMMELLARDCELLAVILADREDDDAPYAAALTSHGIHVVGHGFRTAVLMLIRESFQAVFFEFYHAALRLLPLVRRLQPQSLVIVDSVDVHYLREREAARLGTLDKAVPAQTERDELAVYRAADVTIVVSAQESDVLREAGLVHTVVVPNIVTVVPRALRVRAPSLLFVGGFDHEPNALAVHWFNDHVWPLVLSARPDATWIVAGSKVTAGILALHGHDNVNVVGFVPSTTTLLDEVEVSIAPLTFGGGMKGKVSEALAAGVPVVTTQWGAQGFEEGRDTAFLQADTAADFARAVVRLLADPVLRAELGEAGQRMAQRVSSAAAAAPALAALVKRTTDAGPAPALPARLLAFAAVVTQRFSARLFRTARRRLAAP